MTNPKIISKFLITSALSFGLSAGAMAEDRPSHPDLSATANKAATEKKTPGEANAHEVSKHRANATENASDAEITKQVKAQLTADKDLQTKDISVQTNKGVTTLTGTVSNDSEHKKVTAIAEKVQGVSKVDSTGLKVKAD